MEDSDTQNPLDMTYDDDETGIVVVTPKFVMYVVQLHI